MRSGTLSTREVYALFEVISGARDSAILVYHCGLRASEVGRLDLADYRKQEDRLYVHRLKHSFSGCMSPTAEPILPGSPVISRLAVRDTCGYPRTPRHSPHVMSADNVHERNAGPTGCVRAGEPRGTTIPTPLPVTLSGALVRFLVRR
jgi:integrase